MYNNSIDLAVLDWFHLFGYHNDDLHWKQIVDDIDIFRQNLFHHISVSEDNWKLYREQIKNYRDKDVAHIQVRPTSQVPEMSIALNAGAYYYQYVLQELSGYSDYNNWPKDLLGYHHGSLAQTERILELAYPPTQQIEEQVF
jgi:hypothetical protein